MDKVDLVEEIVKQGFPHQEWRLRIGVEKEDKV